MKEQLDQELICHLTENRALPKLVILGIGNEVNGDDAAGVLIVRKIKKKLPTIAQVRLIEGSIAPENYSKKIREFDPDWIWLIDAAHTGAIPGAVKFIPLENIAEIGANTHRLSPNLLLYYLHLQFDFKALMIGVQPENIQSFSSISARVRKSINNTSEFLLHWIKSTYKI